MKIITFQDIDTLFEILIKKEYVCNFESKTYKKHKRLYELISDALQQKTNVKCKYPIWGWSLEGHGRSYLFNHISKYLSLMDIGNISMIYVLDIPDDNIVLTNFTEWSNIIKRNPFIFDISQGENIKNIFNYSKNDTVQVSFQSINIDNILEAYIMDFDNEKYIIKDMEQII